MVRSGWGNDGGNRLVDYDVLMGKAWDNDGGRKCIDYVLMAWEA